MATPVFCCGFECGQIGAAGQHWNISAGVAGAISTSTVRSGARSLRVNPSATVTALQPGLTISTQNFVARLYVNFATLPNTNVYLIRAGTTSGGGAIFNSTDNKIYATTGAGGTGATGISVTTGQWYLIDMKLVTTGTRTCDVNVDGVACAQIVGGASSTLLTTSIADSVSVSYSGDFYIDDVIISFTAADYPIGAGYVNHFVPTSDGTHTAAGTTTVKGTIATPVGTAITAATTDAFNWVNAVPLLGGATDNTRLINAQTAASTTYAEVKFGPAPGISTPTTAPRAVEVITADREASTATCDFTAKLNDNGTEGTIIARGVVAGVITDRYATKQFTAGPAGAWTAASSGAGGFNNIKARWGYSSDATPDLYWRGIMIEAEFASVTAFVAAKPIIFSQAVNRAANY